MLRMHADSLGRRRAAFRPQAREILAGQIAQCVLDLVPDFVVNFGRKEVFEQENQLSSVTEPGCRDCRIMCVPVSAANAPPKKPKAKSAG